MVALGQAVSLQGIAGLKIETSDNRAIRGEREGMGTAGERHGQSVRAPLDVPEPEGVVRCGADDSPPVVQE